MKLLPTVLSIGLYLVFAAQAVSAPWNDGERQRAVLNLLNSKSSSFDCKSRCKHEIFNVRSLDFNNHKRKLIVAVSSAPENNCHACAPLLSYFLYRVDHDGWKLTSRHIAYHYFGSWGGYLDELVSFDKLSENEALIVLRFGYTGQGYTEESTTALLPTEQNLRTVLSTCSGSDNEGAIYDPETQTLESWSAKLNARSSFSPTGLNLLHFDLSDAASNQKSDVTFKFDGTKFRYHSGDTRMKGCDFSDQ